MGGGLKIVELDPKKLLFENGSISGGGGELVQRRRTWQLVPFGTMYFLEGEWLTMRMAVPIFLLVSSSNSSNYS